MQWVQFSKQFSPEVACISANGVKSMESADVKFLCAKFEYTNAGNTRTLYMDKDFLQI